MKKKGPLIILLIFVLLISLAPLRARWQQEQENQRVDLIMDLAELDYLILDNPDFTVEDLQEVGLTGAAHPAWTIEDLQERGQLALWRQADLASFSNELQPALADEGIEPAENSAVLYFTPASRELISSRVLTAWQEIYSVEYFSYQQGKVVYFPRWQENLLELVPGYSASRVTDILEKDLLAVARLNDQPAEKLNQVLLAEIARKDISAVIFQGDQVAGFPGDYGDISTIMQENDLIYGYVEPFIADQKGARDLAREFSEQIIRVHSIQQEEMEEYPVERIANRYLRSVRDRNVRYLYLRGFPPERPEENLADLQLDLTSSISAGLEEEGYQLGTAGYFSQQENSGGNLFLATLAVIFGLLLMLKALLPFKLPEKLYLVLLFFVITTTFFSYFWFSEIFYRQLLALAAAIIFPVLAAILIIDIAEERERYLATLPLVFAVTMAGGLLVAQILAQPEFFNQVEIFRGVKYAFIMPLVLAAGYYSKICWQTERFTDLTDRLITLFNLQLKVKHVLGAAFLSVVLVIYIGRTGNLPLIPVPPWEIIIRDQLEQILTVRPRFKEFLFGHPFLFLLPFIGRYLHWELGKIGAVMLAIIGQITIVNSFSHLHTPLATTFVRTFHGFWMGLLVAGLLALFILVLVKIYNLLYSVILEAEIDA